MKQIVQPRAGQKRRRSIFRCSDVHIGRPTGINQPDKIRPAAFTINRIPRIRIAPIEANVSQCRQRRHPLKTPKCRRAADRCPTLWLASEQSARPAAYPAVPRPQPCNDNRAFRQPILQDEHGNAQIIQPLGDIRSLGANVDFFMPAPGATIIAVPFAFSAGGKWTSIDGL